MCVAETWGFATRSVRSLGMHQDLERHVRLCSICLSQSLGNIEYRTTQCHEQHCLCNLLRWETGYNPLLHIFFLHRNALGTHQAQAGAFRWCVLAVCGLDRKPKRCLLKREEWYFLTDSKLWGNVEGRGSWSICMQVDTYSLEEKVT